MNAADIKLDCSGCNSTIKGSAHILLLDLGKLMRLWLFSTLIIFTHSQHLSAQTLLDATNAIWDDCRAANNCTIDYAHLSNQQIDPFLFSGKVMDKDHSRWRQYRKALKRYPDVRDCLLSNQQKNTTPNLLQIDWGKVGTGRGAEVCVYRIARSLGSVERILQWLSFHGFRYRGLNKTYSDGYKVRYATQPISQITATWTREQYREMSDSWFASLTGIDLILKYQLVLQFNQINQIVGVGVVTPTK